MSQVTEVAITTTTTTTTMSGEVGSVKPNPYIFDIENRRKRKPRLAHDLGAGARCKKCEDKCPGFELHFWRKICMNCRCGKDDHDVQDDDEDIGKVVIGKLFERPARTKKEELEFSYGNHLDMVNEETGRPEKVKFDWVPPNTEKGLAARYMALLPPEKRPVAGSEAAKERRKKLEQQVPLYDMDASQRCENMPIEELQSFEAYMERIKTQVAGQGIVQEIVGIPIARIAQPLHAQLQKDPRVMGSSVTQNYLAAKNDPPYKEVDATYAVPYSQSTDQLYVAAPNKNRMSGFREFVEEMTGEPARFMANSDPYGVTPGICQPLRSLGRDQRVADITAQLSDLQTSGNKQNTLSADPHEDDSHNMGNRGQQTMSPDTTWPPPPSFVLGHDQTSILPVSVLNQENLPGQNFVRGKQGILSDQQNLTTSRQNQPGQSFTPGVYDFGKQDTLPRKDFIPSKQDVLSGHQSSVPGQSSRLSGQRDVVLDKQGSPLSKESLVSSKQNRLPDVGSPRQRAPFIDPVEQPFSPGKDTMIHRYQMGGSEPVNSLAQEEARVLGSYKTSNRTGALSQGKESGRLGISPNSPLGGSIADKEAIQAPYDAYRETLIGSTQVAPGSDVMVLFPDESRVLGSHDVSGETPEQKSKYSCQYCALPMSVGDVAIFCERAGPDKCWHPACFSCFTCKELLADLIYFYKDGKVYCGRHFTDAADIPRCKSCDELIFGDSWTRADGFNWHIHHYCCHICDTPLAGQKYVPDKDGLPYCLPCHMAYLAKMCQTCEIKIAPTENQCRHRGYCYHAKPECFQCYSCKTPLLGRKFKMSKNWLFCSNECVQSAAIDLANNPNPKEMPE